MEDYGQYIDIEKGLCNDSSYSFISIRNNHVAIDINDDVLIDNYISMERPIDIVPYAIQYLVYCVRRIINM